MNHETTQQLDASFAVETTETELEIIAKAMQVRSGIQAGRGIQPCI